MEEFFTQDGDDRIRVLSNGTIIRDNYGETEILTVEGLQRERNIMRQLNRLKYFATFRKNKFFKAWKHYTCVMRTQKRTSDVINASIYSNPFLPEILSILQRDLIYYIQFELELFYCERKESINVSYFLEKQLERIKELQLLLTDRLINVCRTVAQKYHAIIEYIEKTEVTEVIRQHPYVHINSDEHDSIVDWKSLRSIQRVIDAVRNKFFRVIAVAQQKLEYALTVSISRLWKQFRQIFTKLNNVELISRIEIDHETSSDEDFKVAQEFHQQYRNPSISSKGDSDRWFYVTKKYEEHCNRLSLSVQFVERETNKVVEDLSYINSPNRIHPVFLPMKSDVIGGFQSLVSSIGLLLQNFPTLKQVLENATAMEQKSPNVNQGVDGIGEASPNRKGKPSQGIDQYLSLLQTRPIFNCLNGLSDISQCFALIDSAFSIVHDLKPLLSPLLIVYGKLGSFKSEYMRSILERSKLVDAAQDSLGKAIAVPFLDSKYSKSAIQSVPRINLHNSSALDQAYMAEKSHASTLESFADYFFTARKVNRWFPNIQHCCGLLASFNEVVNHLERYREHQQSELFRILPLCYQSRLLQHMHYYENNEKLLDIDENVESFDHMTVYLKRIAIFDNTKQYMEHESHFIQSLFDQLQSHDSSKSQSTCVNNDNLAYHTSSRDKSKTEKYLSKSFLVNLTENYNRCRESFEIKLNSVRSYLLMHVKFLKVELLNQCKSVADSIDEEIVNLRNHHENYSTKSVTARKQDQNSLTTLSDGLDFKTFQNISLDETKYTIIIKSINDIGSRVIRLREKVQNLIVSQILFLNAQELFDCWETIVTVENIEFFNNMTILETKFQLQQQLWQNLLELSQWKKSFHSRRLSGIDLYKCRDQLLKIKESFESIRVSLVVEYGESQSELVRLEEAIQIFLPRIDIAICLSQSLFERKHLKVLSSAVFALCGFQLKFIDSQSTDTVVWNTSTGQNLGQLRKIIIDDIFTKGMQKHELVIKAVVADATFESLINNLIFSVRNTMKCCIAQVSSEWSISNYWSVEKIRFEIRYVTNIYQLMLCLYRCHHVLTFAYDIVIGIKLFRSSSTITEEIKDLRDNILAKMISFTSNYFDIQSKWLTNHRWKVHSTDDESDRDQDRNFQKSQEEYKLLEANFLDNHSGNLYHLVTTSTENDMDTTVVSSFLSLISEDHVNTVQAMLVAFPRLSILPYHGLRQAMNIWTTGMVTVLKNASDQTSTTSIHSPSWSTIYSKKYFNTLRLIRFSDSFKILKKLISNTLSSLYPLIDEMIAYFHTIDRLYYCLGFQAKENQETVFFDNPIPLHHRNIADFLIEFELALKCALRRHSEQIISDRVIELRYVLESFNVIQLIQYIQDCFRLRMERLLAVANVTDSSKLTDIRDNFCNQSFYLSNYCEFAEDVWLCLGRPIGSYLIAKPSMKESSGSMLISVWKNSLNSLEKQCHENVNKLLMLVQLQLKDNGHSRLTTQRSLMISSLLKAELAFSKVIHRMLESENVDEAKTIWSKEYQLLYRSHDSVINEDHPFLINLGQYKIAYEMEYSGPCLGFYQFEILTVSLMKVFDSFVIGKPVAFFESTSDKLSRESSISTNGIDGLQGMLACALGRFLIKLPFINTNACKFALSRAIFMNGMITIELNASNIDHIDNFTSVYHASLESIKTKNYHQLLDNLKYPRKCSFSKSVGQTDRSRILLTNLDLLLSTPGHQMNPIIVANLQMDSEKIIFYRKSLETVFSVIRSDQGIYGVDSNALSSSFSFYFLINLSAAGFIYSSVLAGLVENFLVELNYESSTAMSRSHTITITDAKRIIDRASSLLVLVDKFHLIEIIGERKALTLEIFCFVSILIEDILFHYNVDVESIQNALNKCMHQHFPLEEKRYMSEMIFHSRNNSKHGRLQYLLRVSARKCGYVADNHFLHDVSKLWSLITSQRSDRRLLIVLGESRSGKSSILQTVMTAMQLRNSFLHNDNSMRYYCNILKSSIIFQAARVIANCVYQYCRRNNSLSDLRRPSFHPYSDSVSTRRHMKTDVMEETSSKLTSVKSFLLFHDSLSTADLFGDFNHDGEWNDGLLTRLFRRIDESLRMKDSSEVRHIIVLDGPINHNIEQLFTLVKSKLPLGYGFSTHSTYLYSPSGEIFFCFGDQITLIIETPNISHSYFSFIGTHAIVPRLFIDTSPKIAMRRLLMTWLMSLKSWMFCDVWRNYWMKPYTFLKSLLIHSEFLWKLISYESDSGVMTSLLISKISTMLKCLEELLLQCQELLVITAKFVCAETKVAEKIDIGYFPSSENNLNKKILLDQIKTEEELLLLRVHGCFAYSCLWAFGGSVNGSTSQQLFELVFFENLKTIIDWDYFVNAQSESLFELVFDIKTAKLIKSQRINEITCRSFEYPFLSSEKNRRCIYVDIKSPRSEGDMLAFNGHTITVSTPYQRSIEAIIQILLKSSSNILLLGPSNCGKSFLIRHLLSSLRENRWSYQSFYKSTIANIMSAIVSLKKTEDFTPNLHHSNVKVSLQSQADDYQDLTDLQSTVETINSLLSVLLKEFSDLNSFSCVLSTLKTSHRLLSILQAIPSDANMSAGTFEDIFREFNSKILDLWSLPMRRMRLVCSSRTLHSSQTTMSAQESNHRIRKFIYQHYSANNSLQAERMTCSRSVVFIDDLHLIFSDKHVHSTEGTANGLLTGLLKTSSNIFNVRPNLSGNRQYYDVKAMVKDPTISAYENLFFQYSQPKYPILHRCLITDASNLSSNREMDNIPLPLLSFISTSSEDILSVSNRKNQLIHEFDVIKMKQVVAEDIHVILSVGIVNSFSTVGVNGIAESLQSQIISLVNVTMKIMTVCASHDWSSNTASGFSRYLNMSFTSSFCESVMELATIVTNAQTLLQLFTIEWRRHFIDTLPIHPNSSRRELIENRTAAELMQIIDSEWMIDKVWMNENVFNDLRASNGMWVVVPVKNQLVPNESKWNIVTVSMNDKEVYQSTDNSPDCDENATVFRVTMGSDLCFDSQVLCYQSAMLNVLRMTRILSSSSGRRFMFSWGYNGFSRSTAIRLASKLAGFTTFHEFNVKHASNLANDPSESYFQSRSLKIFLKMCYLRSLGFIRAKSTTDGISSSDIDNGQSGDSEGWHNILQRESGSIAKTLVIIKFAQEMSISDIQILREFIDGDTSSLFDINDIRELATAILQYEVRQSLRDIICYQNESSTAFDNDIEKSEEDGSNSFEEPMHVRKESIFTETPSTSSPQSPRINQRSNPTRKILKDISISSDSQAFEIVSDFFKIMGFKHFSVSLDFDVDCNIPAHALDSTIDQSTKNIHANNRFKSKQSAWSSSKILNSNILTSHMIGDQCLSNLVDRHFMPFWWHTNTAEAMISISSLHSHPNEQVLVSLISAHNNSQRGNLSLRTPIAYIKMKEPLGNAHKLPNRSLVSFNQSNLLIRLRIFNQFGKFAVGQEITQIDVPQSANLSNNFDDTDEKAFRTVIDEIKRESNSILFAVLGVLPSSDAYVTYKPFYVPQRSSEEIIASSFSLIYRIIDDGISQLIRKRILYSTARDSIKGTVSVLLSTTEICDCLRVSIAASKKLIQKLEIRRAEANERFKDRRSFHEQSNHYESMQMLMEDLNALKVKMYQIYKDSNDLISAQKRRLQSVGEYDISDLNDLFGRGVGSTIAVQRRNVSLMLPINDMARPPTQYINLLRGIMDLLDYIPKKLGKGDKDRRTGQLKDEAVCKQAAFFLQDTEFINDLVNISPMSLSLERIEALHEFNIHQNPQIAKLAIGQSFEYIQSIPPTRNEIYDSLLIYLLAIDVFVSSSQWLQSKKIEVSGMENLLDRMAERDKVLLGQFEVDYAAELEDINENQKSIESNIFLAQEKIDIIVKMSTATVSPTGTLLHGDNRLSSVDEENQSLLRHLQHLHDYYAREVISLDHEVREVLTDVVVASVILFRYGWLPEMERSKIVSTVQCKLFSTREKGKIDQHLGNMRARMSSIGSLVDITDILRWNKSCRLSMTPSTTNHVLINCIYLSHLTPMYTYIIDPDFVASKFISATCPKNYQIIEYTAQQFTFTVFESRLQMMREETLLSTNNENDSNFHESITKSSSTIADAQTVYDPSIKSLNDIRICLIIRDLQAGISEDLVRLLSGELVMRKTIIKTALKPKEDLTNKHMKTRPEIYEENAHEGNEIYVDISASSVETSEYICLGSHVRVYLISSTPVSRTPERFGNSEQLCSPLPSACMRYVTIVNWDLLGSFDQARDCFVNNSGGYQVWVQNLITKSLIVNTRINHLDIMDEVNEEMRLAASIIKAQYDKITSLIYKFEVSRRNNRDISIGFLQHMDILRECLLTNFSVKKRSLLLDDILSTSRKLSVYYDSLYSATVQCGKTITLCRLLLPKDIVPPLFLCPDHFVRKLCHNINMEYMSSLPISLSKVSKMVQSISTLKEKYKQRRTTSNPTNTVTKRSIAQSTELSPLKSELNFQEIRRKTRLAYRSLLQRSCNNAGASFRNCFLKSLSRNITAASVNIIIENIRPGWEEMTHAFLLLASSPDAALFVADIGTYINIARPLSLKSCLDKSRQWLNFNIFTTTSIHQDPESFLSIDVISNCELYDPSCNWGGRWKAFATLLEPACHDTFVNLNIDSLSRSEDALQFEKISCEAIREFLHLPIDFSEKIRRSESSPVKFVYDAILDSNITELNSGDDEKSASNINLCKDFDTLDMLHDLSIESKYNNAPLLMRGNNDPRILHRLLDQCKQFSVPYASQSYDQSIPRVKAVEEFDLTSFYVRNMLRFVFGEKSAMQSQRSSGSLNPLLVTWRSRLLSLNLSNIKSPQELHGELSRIRIPIRQSLSASDKDGIEQSEKLVELSITCQLILIEVLCPGRSLDVIRLLTLGIETICRIQSNPNVSVDDSNIKEMHETVYKRGSNYCDFIDLLGASFDRIIAQLDVVSLKLASFPKRSRMSNLMLSDESSSFMNVVSYSKYYFNQTVPNHTRTDYHRIYLSSMESIEQFDSSDISTKIHIKDPFKLNHISTMYTFNRRLLLESMMLAEAVRVQIDFRGERIEIHQCFQYDQVRLISTYDHILSRSIDNQRQFWSKPMLSEVMKTIRSVSAQLLTQSDQRKLLVLQDVPLMSSIGNAIVTQIRVNHNQIISESHGCTEPEIISRAAKFRNSYQGRSAVSNTSRNALASNAILSGHQSHESAGFAYPLVLVHCRLDMVSTGSGPHEELGDETLYWLPLYSLFDLVHDGSSNGPVHRVSLLDSGSILLNHLEIVIQKVSNRLKHFPQTHQQHIGDDDAKQVNRIVASLWVLQQITVILTNKTNDITTCIADLIYMNEASLWDYRQMSHRVMKLTLYVSAVKAAGTFNRESFSYLVRRCLDIFPVNIVYVSKEDNSVRLRLSEMNQEGLQPTRPVDSQPSRIDQDISTGVNRGARVRRQSTSYHYKDTSTSAQIVVQESSPLESLLSSLTLLEKSTAAAGIGSKIHISKNRNDAFLWYALEYLKLVYELEDRNDVVDTDTKYLNMCVGRLQEKGLLLFLARWTNDPFFKDSKQSFVSIERKREIQKLILNYFKKIKQSEKLLR